MRSIPLDLKYSSSQSPFSAFQTFHEGNVSNEKEASPSPSSSSSLSAISPFILLVITVLSVIFFIYGLVHLVLWFLLKRPSSSSILYNSNRFPESTTRTRALQRQLHHLFHLHDSGLDQTLIDTLPLFNYQDLLNLKEPFDCAVCLSEFSEHDKLRLLPMCSHAFHMDCLDTWLLSNSSCPLCRSTALSSSVEEIPISNDDDENSFSLVVSDKEENGNGCAEEQKIVKRVLSVRLGKFRNNGLEGGEGIESGSDFNLDARRCYSMGSYEYVVHDTSLQVVLSQSHEEGENGNVEGKKIGKRAKGDSFSVSKIWLWSKKSKFHSSNAAFP